MSRVDNWKLVSLRELVDRLAEALGDPRWELRARRALRADDDGEALSAAIQDALARQPDVRVVALHWLLGGTSALPH